MKCDVVIDLQYGSTAKGKICARLAKTGKYDASVRVQSIQAGHTIYYKGEAFKMQTIPVAWVDPNVDLILGAGIFIKKSLLLKEIEMINEAMGGDVRKRLYLDYRANYITQADIDAESSNELTRKIGSTGEGAGSSLIRKIWRKDEPTRVEDDDWAIRNGLKVVDTIERMNDYSNKILLEGCQGTMLSVHTSPEYPFVTSRECTVSGIASEAGISPKDIDEIHGVFRTYPIRVGGNSGKTDGEELTWEEIAKRSGYDSLVPEITTVTKRQRRIFEFSVKEMKHAIMVNKPTHYHITFADYINREDYGKHGEFSGLTNDSQHFMNFVENELGIELNTIGTGEKPDHIIIL